MNRWESAGVLIHRSGRYFTGSSISTFTHSTLLYDDSVEWWSGLSGALVGWSKSLLCARQANSHSHRNQGEGGREQRGRKGQGQKAKSVRDLRCLELSNKPVKLPRVCAVYSRETKSDDDAILAVPSPSPSQSSQWISMNGLATASIAHFGWLDPNSTELSTVGEVGMRGCTS